ncbi:Ubiquitin carboxyl-terminal hydrolase 35 [Mortierella hygrophila]|uniref:Ubiquitin carboxyl-terminal hydrolase 35 n=1 Tax=Mortierella hygrophila TaxID=979708 RepID=A0A9P6K1Y6_9FUNG|nr:Ubiquitin carboxyl-terminal hydrolase 35 [Mortierella hygrophila]
METVIRKVLAASHLPDNDKKRAINTLLARNVSTLSKPDTSLLLDLGLELKTASNRTLLDDWTGDRILEAVSNTHRDLFWAVLHTDWFHNKISCTITNMDFVRNIMFMVQVARRKEATALTEDDKLELEQDMTALRIFAEKKCISAQSPLDYTLQGIFIVMFINLPASRPLVVSDYIQFLVDHIASSPVTSGPSQEANLQSTKNATLLLRQCWDDRPDNVVLTLPHLLFYLSDTQTACPLAIGRLVGAVPPNFTSYVEPFIQGMDRSALWRLQLPIQRLIDWLVTTDMPGTGVWIVSLMESLASQGEFMILRELADKNAYKVARQLAFRERRNDALPVLRLILLGYHHSDVLFKHISQGLIPLVVPCRKTPEDREFAAEVCSLAQTLVIHFGDVDDIGTKVQKARMALDLPIVPRAEALRTMQENSWKKGLHIQNTSAGLRRKAALVQPLGKVGLVNLGNSCFMNSALRALFCSGDFSRAVLNDTAKVPQTKALTTRLREAFTGMSNSRLSIYTPLTLYKALPNWLNDGHQQDAAEFTKILFSLMEDEDPLSKQALSSFHGTVVNQIKCRVCGTVSSNKEGFYDLAVPLPATDSSLDLQSVVDVFPSVEELNEQNNNMYHCDKCHALRAATRYTMLASLPTNLIVTLNRFRFDVQRSRRIKINTPIRLAESIQIKVQDGHDLQEYELYAVVIHTGESANHGHYYTYAKDSGPTITTSTEGSSSSVAVAKSTWLLYNDTSVKLSSFEAMQQALANSRTETPYMLFFRKTELQSSRTHAPLARTISNL